MNMITKYDENKYFIVDEDAEMLVQLLRLNGNGWGNIKKKDNKTEAINLDRLTPYEEKDKVTQERIATITKIQFTILNKDKTITIKTLEGEEATKWEKMMVDVCMFADVHKVNPDWLALKWKNEEVANG